MKITDLRRALDSVRWSLCKIRVYMEKGYNDRALMRINETINAIDKFNGPRYSKKKAHPPSKVCV